MRAALYQTTGPAAKVLEIVDVQRPDAGPGEVRIRLAVSGVNPTDCKRRAGATPAQMPEAGQIPHHDGAGTVDAVGPGVDPARVGQRVWVWMAASGRRWGTAAEWTVVPARQAVPLPDGASFSLGAMLGVPAMTAHRCLFADGPLSGRRVLVAGGAGAVGNFAIQLAKAAGAWVVATVSNDDKARNAIAAGADATVNYREPDARDQLISLTSPVDRVVELALGANLNLDLAVASPDTTISVYASESTDPTLPVARCQRAGVSLRFVSLYFAPPTAIDHAITDITIALERGQLSELPCRHHPLADIAAAHDAVEAQTPAKILVDID